jgi:mono/diheme cytochrome c family protein
MEMPGVLLMPVSRRNAATRTVRLTTAASVLALAIGVLLAPRPTIGQDARKPAATASDSSPVARGRYIVEDVAACGTCHTPRKPNGELDRSRWLDGASVPYLPAGPHADWPTVAPRLAGSPPTNDAGMVTLLMTAVWVDGKPLRDPMPKFHMSRSDAEAVLAYLKSLPANK